MTNCLTAMSLGLTVLMLGVGCDSVRLKGEPTDVPERTVSSVWPFAPLSMRVHPFTAIDYDAEQDAVVLEARIELRDQVGDLTKGVGDFRFELSSRSMEASADAASDRTMYRWDVPMATLDQNQMYYDRITRTYAFRLRMDRQPDSQTSLRLSVQFTDPTGRRMAAEADLNL